MSSRIESNQTIHDEAAYWTALLDSGEALSTVQLQTFHSWLGQPCNERAFKEYRSMVFLVQDLSKDERDMLAALPVPEPWFPTVSTLLAHPLKYAAIAFTAVAVVTLSVWFGARPLREFASQTYTTGTGEDRTVVLRDGSVAHLNTQSSLRWTGLGNDRRVALERGEVLFKVAHDPTRPFLVTAGNSEIRELATEFDVYRKANGNIIVTVLSGKVIVKELVTSGAEPAWTERELSSNQQIEYTPAKLVADVHNVAAPKTVRWREGLLETEGQSFSNIVSELGRYTTKQILIADPRLEAASFKFGGALNIHDIPAALDYIQQLEPIVVTDRDDSYVLTYKADASGTVQPDATQPIDAERP